MATKMTKDIGIDLCQYLMTSKAPKDNGPTIITSKRLIQRLYNLCWPPKAGIWNC
ncbi:hypothetical protein BRLA_c030150 [Brevibacillus laterosporus LMG 15441]|uniref:Uncharacterized protein n=1 Tax=Brevibacillus laterosporus LMG 15441 TaxID=1042163 RepID=A0A075R472_BRELA|nr:hypothetical protein BRLA_c030150 [Brevibacillus laterosporus LMG 15441]